MGAIEVESFVGNWGFEVSGSSLGALWELVAVALNLGNKDTCAVYPKSLRVNRKHVLEALLWLKKHNPHYSNISIKESNLDWMQGEEEVSIATNADKFQTKNLKHIRILSGKEPEYVSPSAQQVDTDSDDLGITTMHANQPNPLPTGDNARYHK